MQLVRIADCISYVRDRQLGQPQQFGGLSHAVGDQEFLGRLACIFVEDLAEITSVQAAGSSDILHGDIVLKILFNKRKGFLNIEVPQTVSAADLGGGGGAHKAVNEEEEMPDQMKGRRIFVIDDIEHF